MWKQIKFPFTHKKQCISIGITSYFDSFQNKNNVITSCSIKLLTR
jgi:hypothetical protein